MADFSHPPLPHTQPPFPPPHSLAWEDEKDMYGGGASTKKSQPYKAQPGGAWRLNMQTTMYGF